MSNGVFEIKGEINDIVAAMVVKQLLDFADKNPVSTIASGKVGGIATLILAAGAPGMRFAYKESTVSFGLFLVNKDVQSIPPELNAVIHKIYSILATHTKMWVEQIVEMADLETVWDAEQAKKNGLIDKIMD